MRRALLLLVLALLASAGRAGAFICLRTDGGACLRWAEGSATIGAFLLLNGTSNFNPIAIEAANDWNATGAAFHFTVTGGTFNSPCGPRGPGHVCPNTGPAGDNPAFFSDSVCGGGFGDIIAQTNSCFDRNSGALINTAVFVNSSVPWSAYDGPIRPPLNDIRRVLVHEFGHVLGLDHPDIQGQTVKAIMNSRESNIDRLQDDDVAGIFSLYPNAPPPGGTNTGCALQPPGVSRANWLPVLPVGLALLRRWHRRRCACQL